MALNLSRLFKGRSAADSVVTDNQHPHDGAVTPGVKWEGPDYDDATNHAPAQHSATQVNSLDQSTPILASHGGGAAGLISGVDFPKTDGYTATDDLWKVRGNGPSGDDTTARHAAPGAPHAGFVSKIDLPQAKSDHAATDGPSGDDATARHAAPGAPHAGEGFMSQDGELWPRARGVEAISGQGAGDPVPTDSLHGHAGFVSKIDLPQAKSDHAATDGPGDDATARHAAPGASHAGGGFMSQDGELWPRLRDSEIQTARGEVQDGSGTDNANRHAAPGAPHAGFVSKIDLPQAKSDHAATDGPGGDATARHAAPGLPHQGVEHTDDFGGGFHVDADAQTTLLDLHAHSADADGGLLQHQVDVPHHMPDTSHHLPDGSHHDVGDAHGHGHESVLDHLPHIDI